MGKNKDGKGQAYDEAFRREAVRLLATSGRTIQNALIARIDVRAETVDIAIRPAVLPDVVKPDLDIQRLLETPQGPAQVLSVPVWLRRSGRETKLLIQDVLGAEPPRRSDRSLLRLIAMSRRFCDRDIGLIDCTGRFHRFAPPRWRLRSAAKPAKVIVK
ncbi:MAG: hypothetical protein K0U74_16880 [Alphaproteobacteria bacterium]|nr:hypothetical protein [Alphaproteobacteria bacterium]